MIFVEVLKCIFAGMKIGFQAFFSVLPVYNQLSGLRQDLICAVLCIPTILVTVVILIFKTVKFIKKHSS